MTTIESQPPSAGSPESAVASRAVAATKIYGAGHTEVVALDELDVSFAAGEFSAIMGPSGSGKSTLMHCLAGLDSLTSGQVLLGEVDLTQLSQRDLTLLRRDRIGFVFQTFNLVPTLTALENITLPADLAGRKSDKDWVDEVVRTLALTDRIRHRPTELSGGQQQRVAVARALAARPEVIFADEPTGNLDSRSGGEVLGFLRNAVETLGQTIVVVTHDPNAASISDRVVFLYDGKIVHDVREPTAAQLLDTMKQLGG